MPEILGWHQDWPDGHSPYRVWWKGATQQPLGWTPSIDDMLAWLVATGHVWSAQKFRTGVAVVICYVETGVEWFPPAFEAPTLHAALEAAVRAVDDKVTQTPSPASGRSTVAVPDTAVAQPLVTPPSGVGRAAAVDQGGAL